MLVLNAGPKDLVVNNVKKLIFLLTAYSSFKKLSQLQHHRVYNLNENFRNAKKCNENSNQTQPLKTPEIYVPRWKLVRRKSRQRWCTMHKWKLWAVV